MAFTSRITLLAALAVAAFQAQAVNVTVAYQTSAEPAKVAQADNTFAKESGATVDWRKFDSGASIVRALASGDVQIGNLGSSPLAVATSQQVPIEVFLLASKLGNSEALVVKKTISKPEDLIGKRIAVPFISTTHYSLLSALKHWGIKPGQVQIINLQPPAIIAAWQQGATRYGVGAGGSGHVSGYSEAHRALEEALADWLGYPRALLFISGFAANQALIAALQNGEIHAAGLDVFEHEPLAKDSPLLSLPNVVALPHIGSATHETRYNMAACAVDNLIDALNGNVEKNCVNPQVK